MFDGEDRERAKEYLRRYVEADLSPPPFLTRERRKILAESQNPADAEMLARYMNSPYRINNMIAPFGVADEVAADLGDEVLRSEIRERRKNIEESGAIEGAPIERGQVVRNQSLFARVLDLLKG